MIRYEVRLEVDPTLAGSVEAYMTDTHIPAILASGCFVGARFDRGEGGAFRTTYLAGSRADFDRYLADHASHFRADFVAHFPDGVQPTRELWTPIREWAAA